MPTTAFTSWIVIWGAVLAYGALHSLLASLRAKTQALQRLGNSAQRAYRLVYNLIAVITLLPVLALPLLLPDRPLYAIANPWLLFTGLIQGLAALTMLAGLLHTDVWHFLGLRQLTNNGNEQPPRLVISGLYRYVRHPLYTAGLVFLWLAPVMTTNILALILGLSLYIYIGARFEERRLIHEFGQAYLDYQRRTPMLLPNLFPSSI